MPAASGPIDPRLGATLDGDVFVGPPHGEPNVPARAARAMLDPGSDFTGIRSALVGSLGLVQVGWTPIRGATGRLVRPLYRCLIDFRALGIVAAQPVFELDPSVDSHDLLVGRDVLRRRIVTFDGPAARFEVRTP